MREWEIIKSMYSKIKALKSDSHNSQKLKEMNNKKEKWEYLGVYHTPYSKKLHERNEELINNAEDCNFITKKEADSFKILSEQFKVKARHAVYVEKLKNEKCYIYKLICKTTKPNYLGQQNIKVETLENGKPHYVSCAESIIQLNRGQFEKDYNKMENCNYVKNHFDPVSRIKEFEEEIKKAQIKEKILYQEDITPAINMEDTLYSYISLKIYEEKGSYETEKNIELDNFMKDSETYTKTYIEKNKLNKIIENLNKNKIEEENVMTSKLPEE
jgi:hypothetical protein